MAKIRKVKPKESQAIKHYMLNGVKIDAYAAAYKCSNMTRKTMQRRAAEVFDRPAVIFEIEKIETRQAKQFDMDVGAIKKVLATVASACLKTKLDAQGNSVPIDPGAVVGSMKEFNRMNGNYAPTKSEVTGKDGEPLSIGIMEIEFVDGKDSEPEMVEK